MPAQFLEEVREDVAQSRWIEAVVKANALSDVKLQQFTYEQLQEMVYLMKVAVPRLATPQEQIGVYGLFETYADLLGSRRTSLDLDIASALFEKASLLERTGRPHDAASTYAQLVTRYSHSKDLELGRLIASALINQALCLASINLNSEAIEIYGRVDALFSDSSDPVIREKVARALNLTGILMYNADKLEEAMERYEEVQRRFSSDFDISIQERVGVSMTNTALTLLRLGRDSEAIGLCETVLNRYGDEPQLWKPTSIALNELGYVALREAKQLKATDDTEEAEGRLRHAADLLRDAVNRRSHEPDPIILGNLGYAWFLQGHKDVARRILAQAIALGGDEIRKAELRDSEISPLPEDAEFRELVSSL